MGEHSIDVGHDPLALIGLVAAAVGAAGYLCLVVRIRGRGWKLRRTLAWLTGSAVVAGTLSGPLAEAADHSYAAHMQVHLLLGMVAPLLLVLGAPVSLLLRAVPVSVGRRISRLLAARPVRALTEPVVAAVLTVGGMWLLYTTTLYPAMHHHPVLHVMVHVHLFAAGYLFTLAMVSVDPLPHRRGFLHRASVLVLALAAHDILAKHLYAHPPVGVAGTAAEVGAMIMYYGGDAVDVVLLAMLGARWYHATRPRSSRPSLSVAIAPAR